MEKIGLIAGNRKFPLLLAESARKSNYNVVAVGIRKETAPVLKNYADKMYWVGLNEFQRLFEIFKSEGIRDVVMAGQISPWRLFSKELSNNEVLKEFLNSIEDKRADTIFGAVAQKLEAEGFNVMDSTLFLKHLMPDKGTLTLKEPGFDLWEDIYFGLDIAKKAAYLDIGQTVAVKSRAIVAVEALEGTDNLIRRAGRLCRGGFTLLKVSKPNQDMRFDIPVVGLATVGNLIRARARCLAFDAGKTLFIDKKQSIALADRYKLIVIAV